MNISLLDIKPVCVDLMLQVLNKEIVINNQQSGFYMLNLQYFI